MIFLFGSELHVCFNQFILTLQIIYRTASPNFNISVHMNEAPHSAAHDLTLPPDKILF